MRPYRIQVYQAADGWRWRIKAGNNRIVADGSEAYSGKRAAARAAKWLRALLWSASVEIV